LFAAAAGRFSFLELRSTFHSRIEARPVFGFHLSVLGLPLPKSSPEATAPPPFVRFSSPCARFPRRCCPGFLSYGSPEARRRVLFSFSLVRFSAALGFAALLLCPASEPLCGDFLTLRRRCSSPQQPPPGFPSLWISRSALPCAAAGFMSFA
jgi:hypothetical protein